MDSKQAENHKQYKRDYYQRNKEALCAKKREQYIKHKESLPKGGIQISRGEFMIVFE